MLRYVIKLAYVYVHATMDTATYVSLWMQLNKKLSPPETQFPYLGPRECVDADQVLKDENSHVSDGQVKHHTFMILYVNSNEDSLQDNKDYQNWYVVLCSVSQFCQITHTHLSAICAADYWP